MICSTIDDDSRLKMLVARALPSLPWAIGGLGFGLSDIEFEFSFGFRRRLARPVGQVFVHAKGGKVGI